MNKLLTALLALLVFSCTKPAPQPKLSLAQWSLHRMIWEKNISPYDFAEYAHNLGFNGLEYVNQLYPEVMLAEDKAAAVEDFVAKNNELAKKYQLQNVLIMIDGEGRLSVADEAERSRAVEKKETKRISLGAQEELYIDTPNKTTRFTINYEKPN